MNNMEAGFFTNTYGLVVCGGKSSRMGRDKSMLQYHTKPQRYYVYDMLQSLSDAVFISCNASQANSIEPDYNYITDDAAFNNIGPMAALLSSFTKFPQKNILLIGCDYPFLTAAELQQFSTHCKDVPAGFYNQSEKIYEPLLTWYPYASFNILKDMYKAEHFSLQHFLKDNNAAKYYPSNKNAIISIDTDEAYINAVEKLRQ